MSSYLNDLHPEVFAVRPRPGGLAIIKRDLRAVTSKHSSSKKGAGGSRGGSRVSSKTTLRSSARRSSKVTIKSTSTGGSIFDSTFQRTSSTPKKTTREHRIKKVLAATPWHLFKEDEEPDNVEPPDPLHDSMTILSLAISTIMLMAANYENVPKEHLVWTLSYLECVKDDFGFHPPNVKGIINNIKLLDNTLTSFFFEEDEEDDVLFVGPDKTPISNSNAAANESPANTPAAT